MGNELDQVRLAALHQAAHDLKGTETADAVVSRAKVYLGFLMSSEESALTELQIRHMTDRFLAWKLPEDFSPDCGIAFDAEAARKVNPINLRYEPCGTNLLNATQAQMMVRFMITGLPVLSY